MKRLSDWEPRYRAAIDASRERPFEWGGHDCCLFAADVVMAITGTDPLQRLRGRYTTAAGAYRVARQIGGPASTFEHALVNAVRYVLSVECGLIKVGRGRAMRGDPVLLHTLEGSRAVGICDGATLLGPADVGIVALPLRYGIEAWRVE